MGNVWTTNVRQPRLRVQDQDQQFAKYINGVGRNSIFIEDRLPEPLRMTRTLDSDFILSRKFRFCCYGKKVFINFFELCEPRDQKLFKNPCARFESRV